MGKFADFMDKVMADEAAKAEFGAVIGARKERELSDDDFQKIVELSEKLGAAVTLDEVKDFFTGNGRELSEEELAGVAGGILEVRWYCNCPLCGEQFNYRWKYETRQTIRKQVKNDLVNHLVGNHSQDYIGSSDSDWAAHKAAEIMDRYGLEHVWGL